MTVLGGLFPVSDETAVEEEHGAGPEAGGDRPGDGDAGFPGRLARIDEFPWLAGLAAGVTGFVGSYLAVLALILATARRVSLGRGPGRVLSEFALVFYNAINIPTYGQISGSTAGMNVTFDVWENGITGWQKVHSVRTVNGTIVEETTRTGTSAAQVPTFPEGYLLAPVIVLLAVAVGFALVRLAVPADRSPRRIAGQAVTGGAAITLGFLLVALLGAYAVAVPERVQSVAYVVHPARFETLLYGAAYPFVLGTLGVGATQLARARRRDGDGGDGEPDAEAAAPPEGAGEDPGYSPP